MASQLPEAGSTSAHRLLIRSGGCSARGSARPANEDGMYLDPQNRFFVVTDGMGGERAGAVASHMAIRALGQRLNGLCADGAERDGNGGWLADVLYDTNDLLLAAKGTDQRLTGMGATAVVAALRRRCLHVAGLGDSRCYLIRGGSAMQLTRDHSVAQSMVDAGMVPADKLKSHPFRNVLHQYLGCSELGDGPCVETVRLQAGDRVLLATDGLTDRVGNDLLADIVGRAGGPRRAARRLLKRAVEAGATDDVTCVAIFIDERSLAENQGSPEGGSADQRQWVGEGTPAGST